MNVKIPTLFVVLKRQIGQPSEMDVFLLFDFTEFNYSAHKLLKIRLLGIFKSINPSQGGEDDPTNSQRDGRMRSRGRRYVARGYV